MRDLKVLLLPFFLAAIAAIGSCSPTFASEALYRRYKARRTFVPDKGTHNPFGRSDVLAADFLTTGFAQADGSDIRAFAGNAGRAAELKIMMMGPGDRARIAVRMLPGVNEYTVCYGGPRDARRGKWEPDVGLILETRRFNGGDVRNARQMQALVKASGPRYGTWFVPHVFQGFNLFGPSDRYVSIYRGWLDAPKTGRYRFATTSDDASYFYVDGKVVSCKPRWGRGPPNARFAGQPVALSAGPHKVEYYHVEGDQWQFCVGAWQPPGERFQLIPPKAFPGVFTAKQVGLRVTGSSAPIDLAFRAAGEVDYEGHRLFKVKFRDATPDRSSRGYSSKWFFGDGTSSEERHPEHVYFRSGEYTVTFALVRGRGLSRIRQKIIVGADWEHQGQRRGDTAARYYEFVKKYDFKSMKSLDLDAALTFFVALGRDLEIIRTAAALFPRTDDVASKTVYRNAVLLGERLRDLKHMPDEALLVFRAALGRQADEGNKAKLRRRIGDTLLYALRKPDEALAEYRQVLDRHGKLEDNVVRLAQLRLGDVYKAKADYDRALAAYKKAAGMLPYKRSHAVNSVRRGAFAQSIQGYLRQKQFDEAQNLLDIWGWEHPLDRIAGEWSLVAAEVALAKGDKGAALREAMDCANANGSGPHADALLAFAGRTHVDEGRGAEAVKIARRIQQKYPESAFQEEAAFLECKGLYLNKQHHEAVKKGVAAYARYAKGGGAPAFLMVAADASLASNDKARAVQLLRLVVKNHGRSDEAKAAGAKLKALGTRGR